MVSVTLTSSWINEDIGSETIEDCLDNHEEVVKVVVIVVFVVVDTALRGSPHTTLRLPFNPAKIMNT